MPRLFTYEEILHDLCQELYGPDWMLSQITDVNRQQARKLYNEQ